MTRLAATSRTGCGSTLRRLLLVMVLALLCWGGVDTPRAEAHAVLEGAHPADGQVLATPPARMELVFNEPVRVVDDSVRLFTPDGRETAVPASVHDHTVVAELPTDGGEGAHTLIYRVVSADGHPVGGAISYGVGSLAGARGGSSDDPADDPGVALLVVITTGVQYLGLVGLAGLLVFDRWILRRSGPGNPFGSLLRTTWLLGLVGATLQIPVLALRDVGATVPDLFRPGTWWPALSTDPLVVAGLVAGAGALAVALGRGRARLPGGRVLPVGSALVPAAAALSAPIWLGHTRTISPEWWGLVVDAAHLAAASVWAGGLLGLVVVLRRARSASAPPSGPPSPTVPDATALARVVVRFSTAALGSVGVLAASGVVLAVLVLPDVPALWGTGYGRTLMIKVGVVVCVLALAGWNRFRLVPAITVRPDENDRWLRLRSVLRRELALVVAVLAITGVLTNSSPDHHHPADTGPRVMRAESQGLTVDGTVSPATRGANELEFGLAHDGEPFTGDNVTVQARLPEQDLGPIDVEVAHDPATGRYRGEVVLPAAGEWQVQVSARTSTYREPVVVVRVRVA